MKRNAWGVSERGEVVDQTTLIITERKEGGMK